MRYPVNDYQTKWYIPLGGEFGFWRTDGKYFHEALDLNLKTGGDTDMGQPVVAVADGEVVMVHNHTAIPTFGTHIWIKHTGPFGVAWSHSCHCQDLAVKIGDKVTEGQQIAKVGKSGTTVGHLHFAIAKKLPNYDFVAKTQAQLEEYFENPLTFIEKWKGVTMGESESMQKFAKKLIEFRSDEEDYRAKRIADGINLDDEGEVDAVVGVLKEYPIIKKDKANTDQENKNYKGFVNRAASKLNLPKPDERDFEPQDIEKELGVLLNKEDQRERLLELWQKVAGARDDYKLQLDVIENFIQDYQTATSKDKLLKERKERIEELERENVTLRESKPSRVFQIGQWFIWIVKKFDKPKEPALEEPKPPTS